MWIFGSQKIMKGLVDLYISQLTEDYTATRVRHCSHANNSVQLNLDTIVL